MPLEQKYSFLDRFYQKSAAKISSVQFGYSSNFNIALQFRVGLTKILYHSFKLFLNWILIHVTFSTFGTECQRKIPFKHLSLTRMISEKMIQAYQWGICRNLLQMKWLNLMSLFCLWTQKMRWTYKNIFLTQPMHNFIFSKREVYNFF